MYLVTVPPVIFCIFQSTDASVSLKRKVEESFVWGKVNLTMKLPFLNEPTILTNSIRKEACFITTKANQSCSFYGMKNAPKILLYVSVLWKPLASSEEFNTQTKNIKSDKDPKRQETQTKTTISFSPDFWSMATGSCTNVKPGFKGERVLRQIGHVILEPSKLNGRGEGTSLLDMHARWPQWATRCRHKQATFVLCGVTRLYGTFIPSLNSNRLSFYILYPSLSRWYLVVSGWLWEILEEADEAGCFRTLSLEFGIDSSTVVYLPKLAYPIQICNSKSTTRLPSLVSECCRSCALQYSESWRPTGPKCWSSPQADNVMVHHVAVCEMQKYTYI